MRNSDGLIVDKEKTTISFGIVISSAVCLPYESVRWKRIRKWFHTQSKQLLMINRCWNAKMPSAEEELIGTCSVHTLFFQVFENGLTVFEWCIEWTNQMLRSQNEHEKFPSWWFWIGASYIIAGKNLLSFPFKI